MNTKPILLVDDELNVLNSLSRTLGEENFECIKTAQDGELALEIIKNTPDLALIVSDYRMPEMTGIELLADVRQKFPDVTRILLTGAADLDMALNAINKGSIFRCLIKPCSSETFLIAVQDGLRQNELIIAERELLSKTLSGSIKVMIDMLSVLSPDIFAQSGRLRTLAHVMANALHLEYQSWEIELAAMLSQIGAVTIPQNILQRWQKGDVLDESDLMMIWSIPHLGKLLINNIPRLENIAEAVGYQNCMYGGPSEPGVPIADNIPSIARILKIILDFDRLVQKSNNPELVFQIMQTRLSEYDPGIFEAFRLVVMRAYNQSSFKLSAHTMLSDEVDYDPKIWEAFRIKQSRADPQDSEQIFDNSSFQLSGASKDEKKIYIDGIKSGMVLSRDVNDKYGILIVSKGTTITDVLMYRLFNYFHAQDITDPIYIEYAQ